LRARRYIKRARRAACEMSDFFGGLRGAIQTPEVVWNQGPLPSGGSLPAPLHQTADARINYNSSLLGDLTPYAYGQPGYLSSQSAYLNIPHKIQKIVPVVYLPEAKKGAVETFDVSHPIDDGDIAFVLRLNRQSIFCTGLRSGEMRRAGLGTAVDPLVNLPTVNYILAGLQLGVNDDTKNLWRELLHNLDPQVFQGKRERSFKDQPISLEDVVRFVRSCVRPFGVARGSEKQGGQDEATISPATWPVSFVTSLTIDGKESNVVNIWHHLDLSAGDDLVLRLKPMPVRPYTLNHYYKGVRRQSWGQQSHFIWQLVPDIMHLTPIGRGKEYDAQQAALAAMPKRLRMVGGIEMQQFEWQEMGYWHIGRSQLMRGRYGEEEYWHNDLANMLKTSHLDMTFQPVFVTMPQAAWRLKKYLRIVAAAAPASPSEDDDDDGANGPRFRSRLSGAAGKWTASLRLESMAEKFPSILRADEGGVDMPDAAPADEAGGGQEDLPAQPEELLAQPDDLLALPDEDDGLGVAAPSLGAKRAKVGKRRAVSGSLLRVDGSSEVTRVGLL